MVTKHEQIKRICNFNFKNNFRESLIEFTQSSHSEIINPTAKQKKIQTISNILSNIKITK